MNYVDPKWTIPPSPVPLWTAAPISLPTVPKELYDRIAVLEAENARLHADLQVALRRWL